MKVKAGEKLGIFALSLSQISLLELTYQQRLLTQAHSELIKQRCEFCSQSGAVTA